MVGGLTKLIATEAIELDNGASLVNANGNIVIESPKLRLNNSRIEAISTIAGDRDNLSQIAGGKSGNIEIQSNSISLDNQSVISTNSELGNGGNIRLSISDSLILRRGSKISTYSLGNGGNINITTKFIRAAPSENSDITANAVLGTGGNINIVAQGFSNIEIRDKESPLTNDITSSSQSASPVGNSQLIQTPQKLEEQPIIDVAQLIDQSLCSVGKTNELTISGRGGLPNPPQQALREDNLWEDWRVAGGSSPNNLSTPKNRVPPKTEVIPREFQGWTVNAGGNIVLTAQANIVTPQGNWLPPLGCQQ